MTLKMFNENKGFIATTDKDIFAVKIRNETDSVNCSLCDEEVKELQILCQYHLQKNKADSNDELKPCPLCKGKMKLIESSIFGCNYYKFMCMDCKMEFAKVQWNLCDYTKSDVIEDWNRRVDE